MTKHRPWLLQPRERFVNDDTRRQADNPWEPWYDLCFGFVVRAETEEAARACAQDEANDRHEHMPEPPTGQWIDARYSSCTLLADEGEEGIVLVDQHRA